MNIDIQFVVGTNGMKEVVRENCVDETYSVRSCLSISLLKYANLKVIFFASAKASCSFFGFFFVCFYFYIFFVLIIIRLLFYAYLNDCSSFSKKGKIVMFCKDYLAVLNWRGFFCFQVRHC